MLTQTDKEMLLNIVENEGGLLSPQIRENSPGKWVFWYEALNSRGEHWTCIIFRSDDKKIVQKWANEAVTFVDKLQNAKKKMILEKYRNAGINI